MRRVVAFVALVILLVASAGVDAGAAPERSLASLRAERAVLLRRIARLTDDAARLQQEAARAAERHYVAAVAQEVARKAVAAELVDAYLDGVTADEVEQLQRIRFAEHTSIEERYVFALHDDSRELALERELAAEEAVAAAEQANEELQRLRGELEKTITEREAADRAAAEARRAATGTTKLGGAPRSVRTTRSQSALFAQFPFGPVSGIPAGLVPTGEVLVGRASWYGPGFDGRQTASGAIFDQEGPTVAHKTLPLGTILLISRGDRHVLALVNDRGPFVAGRILDLSHGVASALGTVSAGVAEVRAQVLVPAS
jgi:rare lipoprotein A (peptidoglycan hydrolase)